MSRNDDADVLSEPLSVRLPENLRLAIIQLARDENRSQSGQVVQMCKEWLVWKRAEAKKIMQTELSGESPVERHPYGTPPPGANDAPELSTGTLSPNRIHRDKAE